MLYMSYAVSPGDFRDEYIVILKTRVEKTYEKIAKAGTHKERRFYEGQRSALQAEISFLEELEFFGQRKGV